MTYRHFKYEGWLYALAFFIALAVRLIALGAMPLTDAEAAPALQALHVSQSADPALDPHPLYILLTSVFFLMYGGGTNFLARLVPALIGSLLVLAPLLLDDRFKPRPSLILAFFLALDPGLVAISRQAASPILAITCLAFTAGFINKNKFHWAAVTAALALLGGPSVWLGLLGIAIAFAIFQPFISKVDRSTSAEGQPAPEVQRASFVIPPSAFITFIAALLIAGTLFFTSPAGLGAAFSSIPAFIKMWTMPSPVLRSMLLLSVLIYQPFALLLTIMSLVRGWAGGLRRIIFLSIWLLVALLLAVFFPARQMADLAWVLIPLNALASLELVRHFTILPEERREVAGVVGLTVFIWVFAWLGMAGINWLVIDTPDYRLRAGMLIGSIFLLMVSLVLIAAGWSIRVARLGGVWGMAVALGVLSLGGLFGSMGLRGMDFPELWWQSGIPMQADLVRDTVSQVSESGTGNDYTASVTIFGVQSPALEWALRENPVQVVDTLDPINPGDFVITTYETDPQLASSYRGQDFVWRQTPSWGFADVASWFRWVPLRQMPTEKEIIILWANSDLFLDK